MPDTRAMSPSKAARPSTAPGSSAASQRRRHLQRVPRQQTLADIVARARAGKPMSKAAVHDTGLHDRAVREFGTWNLALLAAGLRPPRALRIRSVPGSRDPVT